MSDWHISLIAEWPCASLGQINKKPQLCEGKESAVKLALGSLHLIIWKHKSGLEISELDSSVTRCNYNKQTLKENLRCSIISREKINHLCKLIQCTSGIRFICLFCLGSRDEFGAGEWIRGCKSPSCLKGKGGNASGYGGKEDPQKRGTEDSEISFHNFLLDQSYLSLSFSDK